jgi:hypothetical protein
VTSNCPSPRVPRLLLDWNRNDTNPNDSRPTIGIVYATIFKVSSSRRNLLIQRSIPRHKRLPPPSKSPNESDGTSHTAKSLGSNRIGILISTFLRRHRSTDFQRAPPIGLPMERTRLSEKATELLLLRDSLERSPDRSHQRMLPDSYR